MNLNPNYKLSWNDDLRSFIVPISEERVAELVAESRWDGGQLAHKLRVEFGYWLFPGVASEPLHAVKHMDWNSADAALRTRIDAAVFDELCGARDRVDALLERWLPPVEAAVRSGRGLAAVAAELVTAELKETGADDRWFADVVEILDLCFQALQGDVAESEIELIAESVFSSWVAPERNAVLRFADEIAALGMRSRFEVAYGSVPPGEE